MRLLDKIIYCENIQKYLSGDIENPCYEILSSQNHFSSSLLLPEPWNGNIKKASILFISSNPSIDENEFYPTNQWGIKKIRDFFENRFQKYVKNYKYPLLKNNEYRKTHVSFWSNIKNRAKELLPLKNDIILGKDLTITEIVKCKSKKELGVKKAAAECSKKYLEATLNISEAKVMVIVGSVARKHFNQIFSIESNKKYLEIKIKKMVKHVIYIPHSNSHGPCKKIRENISKEELDLVREILT